ncbi:MAG: hypothetical protein R6U32_06515 [Candidatus Woesearchaeota archaeon]
MTKIRLSKEERKDKIKEARRGWINKKDIGPGTLRDIRKKQQQDKKERKREDKEEKKRKREARKRKKQAEKEAKRAEKAIKNPSIEGGKGGKGSRMKGRILLIIMIIALAAAAYLLARYYL